MAWQDIRYDVSASRRNRFRKTSTTADASVKTLLRDISGSVPPGSMLAIMGPSGAGKSTLLDVLSGRKKPSSGRLLTPNDVDVRSISSYVEQEDALLGVLTVRETIWYSAKLSLPPMTTRHELDERTDMIIHDLGLTGVASQRIGTPIQRGISGGQRRRVTIGCSLVTLPRVLFLDEPTSGLDIATAYEVMKAIRSLAVRHRISVMATIHSPNWEIFETFDQCLLLARGRPVYQGDVHDVASYFAALGHPCPRRTNPADHMITLVNDDFLVPDVTVHGADSDGAQNPTSSAVIPHGDVRAFADAWKLNSRFGRPIKPRSDVVPSPGSPGAHPRESVLSQHETQPRGASVEHAHAWSQTVTLTRRNFVNYSRNLLAYGVRIGMYIGMGVLLATVWVNLAKTDTRINDRLSVHFFSVAFLGFMAVAGIPAFLEERSVMKRETGNGLYGPLPFTLANTFSTVPLLFLCSAIFAVIMYWSIGLRPGVAVFFRFLAFLYLGVLAAEFQALLVAALVPIFVAALAIAAFLNGFWMCVQGYFIRAVNLPRFWYYWAHFIDYETYAFNLLVKNDLSSVLFSCSGSVADNTCQCQYPSSLIPQGICAVKGEDVLQALGIDGFNITLYAFILLIITIVYRVLFYVVLKVQLR